MWLRGPVAQPPLGASFRGQGKPLYGLWRKGVRSGWYLPYALDGMTFAIRRGRTFPRRAAGNGPRLYGLTGDHSRRR